MARGRTGAIRLFCRGCDQKNPVAFPILDLQKKRWSPRSFDPNRSIDVATLQSLFEAARWSPLLFQ